MATKSEAPCGRTDRRVFLGRAGACAALALGSTAFAQPGKTIHLVALEAGAQSDLIARTLQPGLAAAFDSAVVIENYGGAGGRIAAQTVLRADADGNTLLVGGANNMVMAPLLSSHAGYDPMVDFLPVASLASVPFALAASARLRVTDLASLVSAARAAKQPLSGGSAGIGGSAHMALQVLFQQLSIPLLHVPFRGTASASLEVVADRIDVVVTDLPRLLPLAREGRLRIVGVTGSRRSALAPDIPTLAEQGATGFHVEPWYALYCRSDVARSKVEAVAASVRRVCAEASYLTHLRQIGFERWNDGVEGVNARMRQDHDRVVSLLANGLLHRE